MTVIGKIDSPGCGCDARDIGPGYASIDQALGAVSDLVRPVPGTRPVALTRAAGRVLAQDVHAETHSPPFDNSAMDGYALRLADLQGSGPWILPVRGRRAAGDPCDAGLPPGAAMQIFTGAVLPSGADAVIMQEDVAQVGNSIRFSCKPRSGTNIRRAGEDLAQGAIVAPAGTRIGPRETAVIAAAGHDTALVRDRVRVALVTTGDEVCRQGGLRGRAGIWDVNTPMLAAALRAAGVDIVSVAHGGDRREDLCAMLRALKDDVDLIVTTGGISVGAADFVKPALLDAGGAIAVSGVAMKPGKPVSFGQLDQTVWLGLPGNPVSAFVAWTLFGTQILNGLNGRRAAGLRRRHVVLGEALDHRPGRCELRLATLRGFDTFGRDVVAFPGTTQSARTSHLPNADGLIMIPAETESLSKGGLVEFIPLD